jgi:hypothetical protein
LEFLDTPTGEIPAGGKIPQETSRKTNSDILAKTKPNFWRAAPGGLEFCWFQLNSRRKPWNSVFRNLLNSCNFVHQ